MKLQNTQKTKTLMIGYGSRERYTERMKTIWRYYRFVAHLAHCTNDFDRMGRLTAKGCNRAHAPEATLRITYDNVLAARHGKSRRWRRRIARGILGYDIKPYQASTDNIFSDILSGAKEEGFVKSHKAEHTSDTYICLTNEGKRLNSLPFGTAFGMLEYSFNAYPRTIFVIFTSLIALLFGILGAWIKVIWLK